MNEQINVVLNSLQTFLTQVAEYLPQLIGAILILIVGWLVARLVSSAAIKTLKLVRLDVLTEKAGINSFLKDGGVELSLIDIIGRLFYWLIMLIVILATFNSLGLGVASDLFNQIVLFIPNIIVAILVLILGVFLARFISEIVVTYAKNVGLENASVIGLLTQYAIIIFTLSVTLTQLNIGQAIVTSAFQLIFGAICLAFGLAFGLGGKEWAAGIYKKYM